jgi:UDPglucose--hexose-1-phosphate uridylyltransferase
VPAREPGLRIDPLTGAHVLVVAARQGRPNRPGTDCPFCPGGTEAPEPYRTRWFVNRWPPLPDDRAEIVLYTPDHGASFADLPLPQAEAVVALWAERTEALGTREDVAYVLVFENRGPEVGATIDHPHGQIYALADVPPAALGELAAPTCALCDEDPGDRLVLATGGWRAWVPHAAAWPYGMVAAPVAHLPDLPAAVASGDGPAALLVDSVARLDALFGAPMPYMLWWHQRPTDGAGWPGAHVHAHIAPLLRAPGRTRFVAAGELGSGLYVNPVDPLDAARALREARIT